MKLRSHLVALVVVAILPVLIFAGALFVVFNNQQRAAQEQRLTERAADLSRDVNRELSASVHALQGLATSKYLDTGDLKQFHDQVRRALKAQPGWEAIVLADPSARQLLNTRVPFGSPLPRSGTPETIKQVLETSRSAISNLFIAPVPKTPLIVIAVPGFIDGRVKYILTASMSPAFLTEILMQQKLPPGWMATIMDANKIIVARTQNLDKFLGQPATPLFAAKSREAYAGLFYGVTLEQIPTATGFRRSEFTSWTVGVDIPLSQLAAPMKHSLTLLAVGGLALLLTGVGLALVVGRRIARPIGALSVSAAALGRGEVPRIPPSPIGEVNEVAQAIENAAVVRKQTEENFRTAVEAAPNGMMIVDREGKIVMVNAQIEKSFGYTREELFGRSVDVLVPKRSRSKHADQMKQYFAHPEPRQLGVGRDLHGVRKDGSEFSVEIGLSPVKIPEGLMALATVVDITQRKLAEESLKKRYEERQTLQEISQIILTSSDIHTTLEKILDQALSSGSFDLGVIRLLDPTTDILEPTVTRGYKNPENIQRHRKKARDDESGEVSLRTMQRSGPRVEENVSQCDGLRTWKIEGVQSAIIVPVRAQDEILGVIQLGSRTPRKFTADEVRLLAAIGDQMGIAVQKARLHQQTQNNLDRLRALHEIDLAITSTLNLRGILDILLEKIDMVLPYSATTVRLFNRESGLLEPMACRNLDEKEWKAEQWKSGRGTPNIVFETKAPLIVRNLAADPRVRDPEFFRRNKLVSYLGVPLNAKDQILGVISFYTRDEHVFSDREVEFLISLASQAAIAIHNAQLYEATVTANRVKEDFLSVMSHELRTPLSVVMGYVGMVKEGMLGAINREQEKALHKVLLRATDQLNMIDDIMQTTQLEARAVKAHCVPFDVRDLLNQLRSDYQVHENKNGVSLIWDYPAVRTPITSDGPKLRQILQNLINNGLKFTDKGSVTVSARLIEEGNGQQAVGDSPGGSPTAPASPVSRASGLTPRGLVEFKVTDTGIGIPKEVQDSIFHKFHQVDSSETRLYGGVGLGLYIVKNFSDLLGGTIEVESAPGKGSTFTVRIPL